MRLSIHPKTQWSTRIGWNGTRSPTTPVDLRPFLNRSSCFELGIIRALQLLSDIFYSIRLSVILCNFTAMPRIFLWNQHHCRQRYRSFQFVKFRDWQSECRPNHLCCLSQVEHVRWWFDDLILARNSAFCSNISRPLGRYVLGCDRTFFISFEFWGAMFRINRCPVMVFVSVIQVVSFQRKSKTIRITFDSPASASRATRYGKNFQGVTLSIGPSLVGEY